MDMSLLPYLRVQMTQHKEYFRCGSMLSVPLGTSGWLSVGKPRVPGLFTFGLPPRKARTHLLCQALTWEPAWSRTCPICAAQCNRKTSVRHVMQDKVICESAYLRWIQFLILEGTQARENCVCTHLSSLQTMHWATGCCRDPVSWKISGGAWRLPAPPHPPLIPNNNQIPLFACSI